MDYTIDTLPSRLTLGRQTETGVNDIRIDMSEWFKQWPELAISIWPTRPSEEAAYPADTYMDGSAIIWRVNNADTAIAGGEAFEDIAADYPALTVDDLAAIRAALDI